MDREIYMQGIASFGDCVCHLKPNAKGKDKLDARWESGVWLGLRDESGESVIGTMEGIVKVRTVRRKPQSEKKWNKEMFVGIKGTPWNTVPGTVQDDT